MDEPLSIALRLLLVVALVLANGLFVAAEFSIVPPRRARMEALIAQGSPLAGLVRRAMADVNNYLAATQLGITMASIGLGFVGEPFLADVIEPVFGWLPEEGRGPAAPTACTPPRRSTSSSRRAARPACWSTGRRSCWRASSASATAGSTRS